MGKRQSPIPSFEFELRYRHQGFSSIAGIDEVGRGAFAGPLVAAAVVLPEKFAYTDKIRDSKLLSAKERTTQAEIIKAHAVFYAIEEIPLTYINQFGVGKAGQLAFSNLVSTVLQAMTSAFFLIDGFPVQGFDPSKQLAIVKGDQKSYSIAAASIIAKVYRDTLMESMGERYSVYNFAKNKGYGTADHRNALKKFGVSDMHRTSFNLTRFLWLMYCVMEFCG